MTKSEHQIREGIESEHILESFHCSVPFRRFSFLAQTKGPVSMFRPRARKISSASATRLSPIPGDPWLSVPRLLVVWLCRQSKFYSLLTVTSNYYANPFSFLLLVCIGLILLNFSSFQINPMRPNCSVVALLPWFGVLIPLSVPRNWSPVQMPRQGFPSVLFDLPPRYGRTPARI